MDRISSPRHLRRGGYALGSCRYLARRTGEASGAGCCHQICTAKRRTSAQGDACDLLPALLDAIPQHHTAVVWSSFAVNQGPIKVKECIDAQIADASRKRTLYRVSLEFLDQAGPQLELMTYEQGRMVKQELLARCAVHGEHMIWLKEPETL